MGCVVAFPLRFVVVWAFYSIWTARGMVADMVVAWWWHGVAGQRDGSGQAARRPQHGSSSSAVSASRTENEPDPAAGVGTPISISLSVATPFSLAVSGQC